MRDFAQHLFLLGITSECHKAYRQHSWKSRHNAEFRPTGIRLSVSTETSRLGVHARAILQLWCLTTRLSQPCSARLSESLKREKSLRSYLWSRRVPWNHGARFRNVSKLLEIACSSEHSSSWMLFRWMILYSLRTGLHQSMVAALSSMGRGYEVRTIEMLQHWNASYSCSDIDYEVIAIGMNLAELQQALNVLVSPIQRKRMLSSLSELVERS